MGADDSRSGSWTVLAILTSKSNLLLIIWSCFLFKMLGREDSSFLVLFPYLNVTLLTHFSRGLYPSRPTVGHNY